MALLALGAVSCTRREGREGSVVCVHGFMRGPANTWLMARALQADGWKVLNWRYPSRDRTVSQHAEVLVARLQELASERPGRPIHFVAHSLGGLVVRAALNHPACPGEARLGAAVLLAPPHRGSALARRLSHFPLARRLFGEHAGRELMEADGFDRLGAFPSGLKVLVLAGTAGFNPWIPGPDDGKVGVEETGLPTPHVLKRLRAGHSWIAWSPGALSAARAFLRGSS